jgi:hypothetical protein
MVSIAILVGIILVLITILIAIGALCAGLLGLLLGHVVAVAHQIGATPDRQEQRHESMMALRMQFPSFFAGGYWRRRWAS